VPGKVTIWLPHDGDTQDKVHDVSYRSAFEAAGYAVEVVPNQGKGAASMRIEAVRRCFPLYWFNESTTEALRAALGWYHEKRDQERGIGLGPEHDWASHTADAFGLGAVAYEAPAAKPVKFEYKRRMTA
jgi:phage terminase large subunit